MFSTKLPLQQQPEQPLHSIVTSAPVATITQRMIVEASLKLCETIPGCIKMAEALQASTSGPTGLVDSAPADYGKFY